MLWAYHEISSYLNSKQFLDIFFFPLSHHNSLWPYVSLYFYGSNPASGRENSKMSFVWYNNVVMLEVLV